MLLPVHITIAIASIVLATYVAFKPRYSILLVAYSLVVFSLLTGLGLALSKPENIVEACVTGLFYLVIVLVAIVIARNKLSRSSTQQNPSDHI